MHALSDQVFSLIVAGLISGLLVPSLMRFIDLRITARAQGQGQVRAQRLELLDRLTRVVWKWRYAAKQVAYYGADLASPRVDRLRYDVAVKEYDAKVWEMFIEIKAIKSACLVWLDEGAANEVEALYSYLKDDIDSCLSDLMLEARNAHGASEAAEAFAKLSERFSNEVTGRLEMHVLELARRIRK